MPNVGRPSRDCHACRQRRIKCDLVRPGCTQCLRKEQECPGYRDETTAPFLIETVGSFPSTLGKNRRKLRIKQEVDADTLVRTSQSVKDVASFLQRHTPLPQPLLEPWNEHFVPLAVMNLLYVDSVYNVLRQAGEGSALFLATYAVGSAYMVNMVRSQKAVSCRVNAYGAAITAINSALQDPQQYHSDSTLLAVWLMSVYELLTLPPSTVRGEPFLKWDIHNRALMEIIRLRGTKQFRRLHGRVLFFQVFFLMYNRILTPDKTYFDEAILWFKEYYRHCEPFEYLILRTYVYTYHCTRLCNDIQEILNDTDSNMPLWCYTSLLEEVDQVESALYPFTDDNPIAECVVDPPLEPYDFANRGYTGTLILRCNYRMRLSHHVLEYLRRASEAPCCTSQQQMMFSQLQNRCIEEISTLGDKISKFQDLLPDSRVRQWAIVGSNIFIHQPPVQCSQQYSPSTVSELSSDDGLEAFEPTSEPWADTN